MKKGKYRFTILDLGVGEWSDLHSGRSTVGESVPRVHWIGGSVGPRAGLDLCRESNLGRQARRYTHWAISATDIL